MADNVSEFSPNDIVVGTDGRKKDCVGIIVSCSEISTERYVVRWGKSSKSLQGYNGRNLRVCGPKIGIHSI